MEIVGVCNRLPRARNLLGGLDALAGAISPDLLRRTDGIRQIIGFPAFVAQNDANVS